MENQFKITYSFGTSAVRYVCVRRWSFISLMFFLAFLVCSSLFFYGRQLLSSESSSELSIQPLDGSEAYAEMPLEDSL